MATALFDIMRRPVFLNGLDILPGRCLLGATVVLTAALTGCASLPPPTVANNNPLGLVATAPLLDSRITAPAKAKRPRKPAPMPSQWNEGATVSDSAPTAPRMGLDPAKILEGEDVPDSAESTAQPTAELASYALEYLGTRYRMGGSSPDTGFDCSGLVGYVTRKVLGLNLPRRAEDISKVGDQIEPDDLEPGDLVFYNTLHRKFSHVGIYLGDGRFVHSPASGGVVRVENMSMAYWKTRFNGARRIAGTEASER